MVELSRNCFLDSYETLVVFLIADGVEAMPDIISSLVVWASVRISDQPPNERYSFGYGKVAPLFELAVGTALLAAAIGIAVQSVHEIFTPHHTPAAFALVMLAISGDVSALQDAALRCSRMAQVHL